MKADNIKFNIKVVIPEQIKITATDLGALLFNLLDNAIEAVREVYEGYLDYKCKENEFNIDILIDAI